MLVFNRKPGSALEISIDGARVFAFVDFSARRVMVPVTNGVNRPTIIQALTQYWPTCTTIEWPEDLDVMEVRV